MAGDPELAVASEESAPPSSHVKFQITSYPAQFTLEVLHSKLTASDPEIVIPEWQRGYVWKLRQASELIDSCLRGLPVPQVFLYRDPQTEELIVVDGNQRLRTIQGFFDGIFPGNKEEFSLVLPNAPWNKLTYEALSPSDRRSLKNFVLPATIIRQDTPKDDSSVFYIFDRLNTGGMQLTPQEVRNAVYRGDLIKLVAELNMHPSWRSLLGTTKPHNRMRDQELIIRFFALQERSDQYSKPMAEFLNSYTGDHRKMKQDQKDKFKDLFEETADRAHKALGDRPFRVGHALNVAVFDSVMVSLAKTGKTLSSADLKSLLENDEYKKLVSTATTDEESIKKRLALVAERCK